MSEQETIISIQTPPPARIRRPRKAAQARAGITFPVSRVHQLFREGHFLTRYRVTASIYVAAVLEYVTAEILEAAGWETINSERKKITPNDISGGINKDLGLKKLVGGPESHLINAGYAHSLPRREPIIKPEPSESFVPKFLRSRHRSIKH